MLLPSIAVYQVIMYLYHDERVHIFGNTSFIRDMNVLRAFLIRTLTLETRKVRNVFEILSRNRIFIESDLVVTSAEADLGKILNGG